MSIQINLIAATLACCYLCTEKSRSRKHCSALNHQCLKCKQWHIAHRLLLTEEGGIKNKKPLQRNVAGALNSIYNITTLL